MVKTKWKMGDLGMGIDIKTHHPSEPGGAAEAKIKLEKDLRSCMRCEFFYGSSRQCIARKCVEEESRVRKMEPCKGSPCFGCPYRKPEGYCFPCMKKMLERKREEKVDW